MSTDYILMSFRSGLLKALDRFGNCQTVKDQYSHIQVHPNTPIGNRICKRSNERKKHTLVALLYGLSDA